MILERIKKSFILQLFFLLFLPLVGILIFTIALLIFIIISGYSDAEADLLVDNGIIRIGETFFTFIIPVLVCTLILKFYSFRSFFRFKINFIAVLLVFAFLLVSFFYQSIVIGVYQFDLSQYISFQSVAPFFQMFLDNAKMSNTEDLFTLYGVGGINDFLRCMVYIAIIPAIAEELFFRGCLQTTVLRFTKHPHLVIFILAVFFSLIHLDISGFIDRTLLGMILGYLFYYGKNLIYPIIFHFCNNFLFVVELFIKTPSKLFLQDTTSYVFEMKDYFICFTVVVITIVLLYFLIKVFKMYTVDKSKKDL